MHWIATLFTAAARSAPVALIAAFVGLISAVISLLSAAAVVWFSRINYRRELTNQRVNFLGAQQKYFEDIKRWADELSDLLSDAIHLCELNPQRLMEKDGDTVFDRRHRLRVRLSSLIDRGRWFFPNVRTTDDSGGRFRGYRQEILNSLVASYREILDINYLEPGKSDQVRERIVDQKKIFVLEVQRVLDPSGRQQEYTALTHVIGAAGSG